MFLLHLCRTESSSMNVGDKHGRWTVLSDPFKEGGHWKVNVRCNCGTARTVKQSDLRRGRTQSCGCYQKERTREANTAHGSRNTRLYNIWVHIVQRCTNPRHCFYEDYGGRGIKVCPEWRSFETFQQWAESAGYADHLTIDRRDNNDGYSPSNCRFVTQTVQVQNRRKQSNNTSGFIGVHKTPSGYRAQASRNRRYIHLGYFDTAIEAAKVRDAFVSKHYDSPTLNF